MEATSQTRYERRRSGQTLVEFGFVLPILLLLVFGVIEFGRMFQSWVTLQNSARAAARHASTGGVNYEIFIPDDTLAENLEDNGDLKPLDIRVLNTIVPCVDGDERGTIATRADGIQVYEGGRESLYATWYDGTDCDPDNEDHTQFRKDILRLFSIMNEAYDRSAALAMNDNEFTGITADRAEELLYRTWDMPLPGDHDQPRYFNVMICSSRGYIDAFSESASSNFASSNVRFVTIRDETDRSLLGTITTEDPDVTNTNDYPLPFCFLNERPPTEIGGEEREGILENAGARWLDAGTGGDRVTVSIQYNHPLITPIRDGSYVYMESRRSTVNEAFRAPKAIGAIQRAAPLGSDEDPEVIATDTPTATLTPTETPTQTATPTHTPTATEVPFLCEAITVQWADNPFSFNEFFFLILNDNRQDIELVNAWISWNPLNEAPDMYMNAMSIEGSVHWTGGPIDASLRPQTQVDTRDDGTFNNNSFRRVNGRGSAVWAGRFQGVPGSLDQFMELWDFQGWFEFQGPENQTCQIDFLRIPEPEPTQPDPNNPPTATWTPNCSNTQRITVTDIGFDTLEGAVYFDILNDEPQPRTMIWIDIAWPDPASGQTNLTQPGSYWLRRVTANGAGPSAGDTTLLWSSSGEGQDAASPTRSQVEGTWHQNLAMPGNGFTTRIWLDFDGPFASMQSIGAQPWEFNGTRFGINCGGNGGSGGGGGGQDGDIGFQRPTPAPTRTPAPSPTPGPTSTPSNTPRPMTNTPRPPQPPTATRTPTPLPTQPPTATPIIIGTPPPSGGGE